MAIGKLFHVSSEHYSLTVSNKYYSGLQTNNSSFSF